MRSRSPETEVRRLRALLHRARRLLTLADHPARGHEQINASVSEEIGVMLLDIDLALAPRRNRGRGR